MALGPRLDLRQTQSLVMTPQLQQAIKLLALSNLELEMFIGEALDANPLLDIGEATGDTPEIPEITVEIAAESGASADELIAQGHGEADAPLDIDPEHARPRPRYRRCDGRRQFRLPTCPAARRAARARKARGSTSAGAMPRPSPNIWTPRSAR